MLADKALRSLDAMLQRRDSQFFSLDAQNNLVAGLDAQRFPKRRGDYQTSVFVHAHPGFRAHTASMTLL